MIVTQSWEVACGGVAVITTDCMDRAGARSEACGGPNRRLKVPTSCATPQLGPQVLALDSPRLGVYLLRFGVPFRSRRSKSSKSVFVSHGDA